MAVRVLLADDHAMVRVGVAKFLVDSEFIVCNEATSSEELLRLAQEERPDLILSDVRFPGPDGISALAQLRKELPGTHVVFLSGYDNLTYLARAAALGAYEYLLKNCTRDELLTTLRAAAQDAPPSDSGIIQQTRRNMHRKRESPDNETSLTNREYQVVRHIAMGLSNREIGSSLGISIETVKEHVQNVLRKVDVNDRTQAAVWAVRKGMV